MRDTRRCRRCGDTKPLSEFVLRDHPEAKAGAWATRHWCGMCLFRGGHITLRQWSAHQAAFHQAVHAEELARAAAREAVRVHQITVQLVDQAADDLVFEAALLRAAQQLHVRSETQ